MSKIYKASMIVIGSEILSGRTRDENINYVANKLVERGVILSEVRVIPDDEGVIINTIHDLKDKFDYVFTCGGIGPTHDDITAVSIAKAFGIEIELHKEVSELLKHECKVHNLTPAIFKMAMIPVGAKLIPNTLSAAPGFIVENVYVMAGVPIIMHAMMDYVAENLKGGAVIHSKTITCKLGESMIAVELEEIQMRFPNVEIGSYPSFDGIEREVGIVLRSSNDKELREAEIVISSMVESKVK